MCFSRTNIIIATNYRTFSMQTKVGHNNDVNGNVLIYSLLVWYSGRLGPFNCQFVNFQRVTFPNSYFSKQQLFQTVTFTNMNFLYPTLCSISTNAGSGEATNRKPGAESISQSSVISYAIHWSPCFHIHLSACTVVE